MDTVNRIKNHLILHYKIYLIVLALMSGFFWSKALAFEPEVGFSSFDEPMDYVFTNTSFKSCPSPNGLCTRTLQGFTSDIEGILESVKIDLCEMAGTVYNATYSISIWNSLNGIPNEELATTEEFPITPLPTCDSGGENTVWETKTFDFSGEVLNITGGGKYFISVRAIGAESYTGKQALRIGASMVDYNENPKQADTEMINFYEYSSWNLYTIRFEVEVSRRILPNLPDYVFCLPHNYIPAGSGDEGEVLSIFSNLYQWIANTPIVGDLLFINCILFTEFYGELETTALINPVFHLKVFGLDEEVDIPLSSTYDQIEAWTANITGFEAFKTALTTFVWIILISLIVKIFFFKGGGGVSVKTNEEDFNDELRSEKQRRKDIDDLDID